MSRKLSIEEMCQIAEKRGGKCLSETYLNNHAPLLWECKIGHRWEATPKNIKRGAWCHSCGGSMKLTIEEMRRSLRPGGSLVASSYIKGDSWLGDWFIKHCYARIGFFSPPFFTIDDIASHFEGFTIRKQGHVKYGVYFEAVKHIH